MKLVLAVTLVSGTAAVHPDRQAQVDFINSSPDVTWKAAVNSRFAHAAPGESKSSNGVKAGQKEALEDAIRKGTVKMQKPLRGALPESFDAAEQWSDCADMINDIRDQSNCGCCWAFAGAEAASDRMCIATNAAIKLPLSAQDVCFCGSDDGCNGGFIQEPWLQIAEEGAVTGGQYQTSDDTCSDFSLPHCHHHGPQGDDPYPAEGEPGCPSESSPQCPTKCDAEKSGEHSNFSDDKYSFRGEIIAAEGEEGIMQAIFTGGPVETAFTVYSDFEDYDGGIYQHVTGDEAGGHAVKIVGWGVESGVKYWKVANSWNPYWGEGGFFRIVKGSNHCGIEDKIAASSPDATWGKVSDIGPYVPVCQDLGILDCSITALLGCEDVAPLCLETCGCCVDNPPAFCTIPDPAPTPPAPTPPAPTPPAPTPPAPTPPAPTPPTPSPTPTPTPSEGQCVLQNSEDDCNGIVEGGLPCRWCVLEYVGDGLCLEPSDPFDDCASVFYRRQRQKAAVV